MHVFVGHQLDLTYLHQMFFLAFGIKENIWASSALLSVYNIGCYSYF